MENSENSVKTSQKNNLAVAILCSILFGLVGSVIYGALYYNGVIAWIGAYAIVMLSGFGYKKFYGRLDKKGYVIISIISFVEAIITIFICLAISVSATYDVSFGTAFQVVFEVLGDSEVLSAVISDIVFSIVFIIAGIVTYYLIEKKKTKESNGQQVSVAQSSEAKSDITKTEETNVQEQVESVSEHATEETKENVCKHCGATIKDGETKCSSCGANLSE